MANEIVKVKQIEIVDRSSSIVTVADRTDALIVEMWLEGRSVKTQRVYRSEAQDLFGFVGQPLAQMKLEDLQRFARRLESKGLAASSRASKLARIKSLFSFASSDGVGHLRFNVAAALKLPKVKETLNERILTEEQVQKMIDAAKPGRDRLIVQMIYWLGVRAEELSSLCWRDVKPIEDGSGAAVVTVFGKGEKTRHLRIEKDVFDRLMEWRMRFSCGSLIVVQHEDAPVFESRERRAISPGRIWGIVTAAAKRAGIGVKASTHWLRHAHATHAIEHGCDVRIVQQSLGHKSLSTTERYIHARPKISSGKFLKKEKGGD